jgi:phage baseplate assembly protein gpV
MSLGVELARRLGDLEREVRRIRAGLVRVGTVASVDAKAGTITVTYLSGVTSAPMPWFQRASEHRPPREGEHALVLDPSLQGTSAIAIAGHPSEANPAPEGGGNKVVVHSDAHGDSDVYEAGTRTISVTALALKVDTCRVDADHVVLGRDAADYAALASRVDTYMKAVDSVIRTWSPVAQDGGSALKVAFLAQFPAPPSSVAAQCVKVK